MRQSRQYLSPNAAMMWSLVLPGFGQIYNKDYIVGFILMGWELLVNVKSNLNLVLLQTFIGDGPGAHLAVNYQWALFYPSVYGFAIWQAYNFAKVNNEKLQGEEGERRTYFSGFFLGFVIGMDFGLFWHDHFYLKKYLVLRIFDYPVYNGLFIGIILGILAQIIENKMYRRQKVASQRQNRT